MRPVELAGQRFGRLVAVEPLPKRCGANIVWSCVCDCGSSAEVSTDKLRTGNTRSCGCLHRDTAAAKGKAQTTHGHKKKGAATGPTFACWRNMIARCTKPSLMEFAAYGGRGITVCERWIHSFENFLADMGEMPVGLSLDRVDNDGNYEPGNCRWATRSEQQRNKRIRRDAPRLEIGGVTKALSEWAKDAGLSPRTIKARLKRGWSPERAVNHPTSIKE